MQAQGTPCAHGQGKGCAAGASAGRVARRPVPWSPSSLCIVSQCQGPPAFLSTSLFVYWLTPMVVLECAPFKPRVSVTACCPSEAEPLCLWSWVSSRDSCLCLCFSVVTLGVPKSLSGSRWLGFPLTREVEGAWLGKSTFPLRKGTRSHFQPRFQRCCLHRGLPAGPAAPQAGLAFPWGKSPPRPLLTSPLFGRAPLSSETPSWSHVLCLP